jgi:putative ABC transport system permease protein
MIRGESVLSNAGGARGATARSVGRRYVVRSGVWRGTGQLVEIEGREVSAGQRAPEYGVSADFFRVYGIPVVQGRVFGSDDRAQSEAVAVVNATLSRKYFGRASPIGSRIRLGEPGKQGPWLTIAGVVGDVKSDSLYREMSWSEAGPIVFRPLDQSPRRRLALAFRLPRGDQATERSVQRRIAELDAEIPVNDVVEADEWIVRQLAYPRFRSAVFGIFAALALGLAAIGLYGQLWQFVAERNREFAVRMAVGATPRDVMWLVARHGGIPVVAGLVIGIVLSRVAGRVLTEFLYDLQASDPRVISGVSAVILAVALVAIGLPARRAIGVDPMAVLRDE